MSSPEKAARTLIAWKVDMTFTPPGVVPWLETLPDGALKTFMVTSLVEESAESFPVSRRTYVPAAENVAEPVTALGALKVTVPGPLTLDHATVRVLFGKPSSVAVPERLTPEGSVTVCPDPAFTLGAWFVAGALLTVTVVSLVLESCESFAVRRMTYEPAAENVAELVSAVGVPRLTVPGPLTLLHPTVRVPFGKPSSVAVPESMTPDGIVTD